MMFFYLGHVVYVNKDVFNFKAVQIALMWALYLALFGLSRYIDMKSQFYATAGVIALYVTAVFIKNKVGIRSWGDKLASYCFGIYIFQQFILIIIYYHTDMHLLISYKLLPWIALVMTFLLSYTLTILIKKVSIGRYLL